MLQVKKQTQECKNVSPEDESSGAKSGLGKDPAS